MGYQESFEKLRNCGAKQTFDGSETYSVRLLQIHSYAYIHLNIWASKVTEKNMKMSFKTTAR